jgi:hypothetical protein
MPSGGDLRIISDMISASSEGVPLKSFIVTSIGVTEVAVPNDPQGIADVADTFSALKNEVLLQFDAESYLAEHGIEEPDVSFVRRLLGELNKELPPGYEVFVHGY